MTAILSLSLISGPDQVRLETRVVEGYEFTLGRGQDADWSLLDPETNILSRRHCMLSQEDGDWWLLDMSGNGTFLNHEREPIGDGGKRRLRDGDRIRLGSYEFQAQLADAEPVRSSFRADAAPWSPLRDTMDGPIGAMPATDAERESVAGGRGAGGFANPFADEEEEPAAPPAPMPVLTQPANRSGNPFADLPEDDAWPPSAPPRSVAEPAVDQANPFADRAGDAAPPKTSSPGADPRPARRPTAWIAEPPPGPEREAPSPAAFPPPEAGRPAPPMDAPLTPPLAEPFAAGPVAPTRPGSSTTPVGSPRAEPLADDPSANPFAEPGDTEASVDPAPPLVSIADTVPPVAAAAALAASPGPSPGPSVVAPTVALPGVAPTAAPAASLAPQDAVLLRALLQGAGIPDANPRDPEQSLHALGAAFRAMITGLREVQRARRTVRGGFRIAQTAWTENPLKLAVNEDDALEALLGAGRRSAMPPARAVEEVLKEIVLHEVATVAAMQEAVRTLLASLSPDKLREIAEQGAGLTVLPAQRKARAWDTYEITHARVTAALQDDFDSVFGRAFARAYERVMAEQKE